MSHPVDAMCCWDTAHVAHGINVYMDTKFQVDGLGLSLYKQVWPGKGKKNVPLDTLIPDLFLCLASKL